MDEERVGRTNRLNSVLDRIVKHIVQLPAMVVPGTVFTLKACRSLNYVMYDIETPLAIARKRSARLGSRLDLLLGWLWLIGEYVLLIY